MYGVSINVDFYTKTTPEASTFEDAHDAVEDGQHTCKPKLEVSVYKDNDAQWCEQFCAPMKLISVIEQFGDVHNGTCIGSGYKHFDHTQQVDMYGISVNVDLYTKSAPNPSTREDLIRCSSKNELTIF